jgi:hypothetical protein
MRFFYAVFETAHIVFKEKQEWQSKFCTEKIRVRQFCAA